MYKTIELYYDNRCPILAAYSHLTWTKKRGADQW
jgi:hypothetical protein